MLMKTAVITFRFANVCVHSTTVTLRCEHALMQTTAVTFRFANVFVQS